MKTPLFAVISLAIAQLAISAADNSEKQSISELSLALLQSEPNSSEYFKAKQALVSSPGYGADLAKILKESATKELDGITLETITQLKTKEALQALAPYLFDFAQPSYHTDVVGSCNILSAVSTFSAMQLADAPVKYQRDKFIKLSDIVAWQRWAVKTAIVPENYSSLIGIPDWLASRSVYDSEREGIPIQKAQQDAAANP